MSDSQQLIVQVFFGLIAAALVTQAITDLRARHWKIGLFLLGAGLVCLLFATKWPSIRVLVPQRFTETTELVATDFRFWLAVITIPYAYSIVRTLRQEIAKSVVEKDLQVIWGILRTFVLPRQLSSTQKTSIARYLQQFPSRRVTLKWARDSKDAQDYLRDIEIALQQGGWMTENTVADEVPDNVWFRYYQPQAQANAPHNPKNPNTDLLIQQAFQQAGVEVVGEITPTHDAEESITLSVGHRRVPRD